MATQQTHANHKRYVFGYHVLAFGGLMINLGWSVRQLARDLSGDRVVAVVLAATLVLVFFYARVFALAAQDRVIRLEEQLRLTQLLPDDLRDRIGELSPGQLIALRFASDAELPGLVRRVLTEGLTDRDAIKHAIREWRPDTFRV